ncbi:MAG TPA: RNA polymerase sigma factor [Candidatus Acidoferrales bacterium]|nr:RNA polymerase sigma factor [Candidatus Acidoferrales bacterium]
MTMVRDITLTEAQQLGRALDASAETFQMDEQAFRTFYDRTARLLWSYLYRGSGNDAALADDLLQESYYRFLRMRLPEMNQDYMKNYLFRIATNLMRDHWRKGKSEPVPLIQAAGSREKRPPELASRGEAEAIHARSDLAGALGSMKPRERELLWLAYVEGSSHREIAHIVGLKEHSVRTLLFRARQKLVLMLRGRGLAPKAR